MKAGTSSPSLNASPGTTRFMSLKKRLALPFVLTLFVLELARAQETGDPEVGVYDWGCGQSTLSEIRREGEFDDIRLIVNKCFETYNSTSTTTCPG
jgi:hypothetical protein